MKPRCLIHPDRPAYHVTAALTRPLELWLCAEDVHIWQARGIEVSTTWKPDADLLSSGCHAAAAHGADVGLGRE